MAGKEEKIIIKSIISNELDYEGRLNRIYEKLYNWVLEETAEDCSDGNQGDEGGHYACRHLCEGVNC